jgi:hypothetical protein
VHVDFILPYKLILDLVSRSFRPERDTFSGVDMLQFLLGLFITVP